MTYERTLASPVMPLFSSCAAPLVVILSRQAWRLTRCWSFVTPLPFTRSATYCLPASLLDSLLGRRRSRSSSSFVPRRRTPSLDEERPLTYSRPLPLRERPKDMDPLLPVQMQLCGGQRQRPRPPAVELK